jgi:hypothetical protein
MAIITRDRAQERDGSHWYRRDGSAAHHQESERRQGKAKHDRLLTPASKSCFRQLQRFLEF